MEAIDKGSWQLKQALEDGKKIIVTTMQKFPFIIEKIGTLQTKKFAIIIDETHSSQSGETARKMNYVLTDDKQNKNEESSTSEDIINALIEKRKMIKNGSYFAFTATPKNKTLETFGTKTSDGKYNTFDNYTMKQAIEEEFIGDVLKNYTTYQSYYKLNKSIENNPEFETRQAHKKLKAYVENHPFSIMEKSKIMLDHFHSEIRKQIKGEAKAMVVCKSIENAIRYFQAFKEYLKEINSSYKAIVAFSGTKEIDGVEMDESQLNTFLGNDIPKEFKKREYRFLIVADKFQTDFDQPLNGEEELYPNPPIMKGKKGYLGFKELDVIIDDFNEKFGIDDWKDADKAKKFLFEQLPADFVRDEVAINAVRNSDKQNAKITSDKKVEDLMQDVIHQYTDLYKKFTDDSDFKQQYLDFVFDKVWD